MRTSTIIEDDPVQAELLKALLEQHNISADVVHDFDGACKAIKEGLTSDLVILDYDLGASNGDGVDLCKRIESTTDIPVLVLTGAKNKEIAVEFMNAGARQFVSKPYNVKELLARINKLISRKPVLFDGSHTDVDSPPVLDFNLMKASYRGVTIAMSAKQLELFEILLSNEGKTVFRDDINFLLNQNAENSRYADTLITKLRRRLAKFPGEIRIRSIRGVGYQLSRSV
jgi:DNA-binding response OmpR family regulator